MEYSIGQWTVIYNAMKTAKIKTAMFYQQFIIGLDTEDYLTYVPLYKNGNIFSIDPVLLNYQYVSEIAVNPSVTSVILGNCGDKILIKDINGDVWETCYSIPTYTRSKIEYEKIKFGKYVYNPDTDPIEPLSPQIINDLYSCKIEEGNKIFIINNHILILPTSRLLPLNKGNKVDICIKDISNGIFTVKFIIHKKKYDVFVIINMNDPMTY